MNLRLLNHSSKILVQNQLISSILLVLTFFFNSTFSSNPKFAKYAGEFLSIGVGGRALGMGEAFTSVANDATAGYWNPAGLVEFSNTHLILMHDERFAGIVNYDYVGFAIKPEKSLSLALSIIRIGVDDIPYTNNALIDNNANGIFDPEIDRLDPNKISFVSSSDWTAIASIGKNVNEKFAFGGNVKFIYRKIATNTGIGIGFDVGIKYKISKFTFGAILRDVTSTLIAWDTGRNELISPSVVVGISREIKILQGKFTPSIDLRTRFEGRRKTSLIGTNFVSFDLNFGAEYTFREKISVRSGFTENKELTLGAGLKLNRIDIDYSFAKFNSELGNTHRISIKISID